MSSLCKHEILCFDSGGYFVRCKQCGVNWVAVTDAHGPNQAIDYTRSQAALFSIDERVKAS
jgi:hypothetical protein